MHKQDLLTKEEFIPKRINQKFASAQNRIKYYNVMANNLRHSLSSINKPLLRNFKILSDLVNNDEEAIFHKEFMKGRGYNFGIITHSETWDGKTVPAIYNFLIVKLENDKVRIIKKTK